jgi:hypothetical protein
VAAQRARPPQRAGVAALASPPGAALGLCPEVVAALDDAEAIVAVEKATGVPSAEALESALEEAGEASRTRPAGWGAAASSSTTGSRRAG